MDTRKEAICNALSAFVRQPPGLDYRNYGSVTSYRQDYARTRRQKADAERLLTAVRHQDDITADMMLAAADGRGRLILKENGIMWALKGAPESWLVEWTAGQYWPLEYRGGVARYLASLLWDWQRENMPPRDDVDNGEDWTYGGVSAGHWLRNKFRQEFGSALQKRYFD